MRRRRRPRLPAGVPDDGHRDRRSRRCGSRARRERALRPGDDRFALARARRSLRRAAGERFDGHDFVSAAFEHGAAAALVAAERANGFAGPLIAVPDTRAALLALAAHWRARFPIPVAVVVGSNGKTTVKEMLAAVLREHHGRDQVLATEGNLNNAVGLPLTLLALRDVHRAAVVELGMNHRGETAELAAIAQPTVAAGQQRAAGTPGVHAHRRRGRGRACRLDPRAAAGRRRRHQRRRPARRGLARRGARTPGRRDRRIRTRPCGGRARSLDAGQRRVLARAVDPGRRCHHCIVGAGTPQRGERARGGDGRAGARRSAGRGRARRSRRSVRCGEGSQRSPRRAAQR